MIRVAAVYENGVLRPAEPLNLAEGQKVEVSVSEPKSVEPPLTEEEIYERIKEAKTLAEWFELTKLLPTDDGGYDIEKRIHANRVWSGGLPYLPEERETP